MNWLSTGCARLAADAGYGDRAGRPATSCRPKGDALAHKPDAQPVARVWSGRGRPPTRTDLRYPNTAVSLAAHARAAGRHAAQTITWREGSKGTMSSQFVFLRVRPAGHASPATPDGTLPERWLIAQRPNDQPEPVKYWLSNLPADTDPARPRPLAKIRWRIEHDYRELKTGLGLDHFEGRPGSAGTATSPSSPPPTRSSPCCDSTQKRLRRPDPLRGHPRLQELLATWTGACPTCHQPVKPLHSNNHHKT